MAQDDPAGIDFWLSIGSTYTYLTVMRIGTIAQQTGVRFNWRPFNVRSIMQAQNNIPFKDKPVKTAYMWRDIERRASKYGLTPQLPAPYPLPELELANRVALVGMREGWGEAYVVEAYRRWFEAGEPAGAEPNLSDSLSSVGANPDAVIEKARSSASGRALEAETDEAERLSVFGTPTFVVDNEVFWGDDRLEDALEWHRCGRLV